MQSPIEACKSVFLGLNKVSDWWLSIAVGTVGFRVALLPIQIVAKRRREALGRIKTVLQTWRNTHFIGDTPRGIARFVKLPAGYGLTGSAIWQKEARRLYALHRCHPLTTLMLSCAQFPLFLTVSAALRDLCAYPFPFLDTPASAAPGLDTQGTLWFENLLLPDPTLITPIALGCMHLWNATFVQSKPFKFLLQTLAVAVVPVATQVPMAIMIYWLVSAICSNVLNRLL
jgi:inner membrane protein COX18